MGYALALLCIIAGLVYFFASNWPVLGREVKVAISIAAMVGFYGIGAVLKRFRHFLGRWMLIGGTLSFGIALALLGQIYNSHADSYWLFLVWLVPTALLALLTNDRMLSVIAVALLQLTCWFYYFPSAYNMEWTEWASFGWLLLFAAVNGVLAGVIRVPWTAYLAYAAMHGWLLTIGITGFSYGRDVWWPYVYAALSAGLLYYFFAVKKQRTYALLTSLFAGLFLLIQYIRLLSDYDEIWMYLTGLAVAAAVLYGGIVLFKRSGLFSERTRVGKWFLAAFQAVITLAVSALATISFNGLLFLLFKLESAYPLFFLSIFGFVLPAWLGRRWNAVIRYTLLATGYGLGLGAAAMGVGNTPLLFYSALLAIGLLFSRDHGIRRLTTVALTLYLFLALPWEDMRGTLLVIAAFNSGLYAYSRWRGNTFLTPLVLALGTLGIATSSDVFSVDGMYIVSNILMVAALAFFLFQHRRQERMIAWWFTALYLVLKYYELVWDLLHKSISLLAVGAALLVWAVWMERRKRFVLSEGTRWHRRVSLFILLIVAAQFVFVGSTVWQKEHLLRHGDVVKLELLPVDPRSVLQGDYIQLQYEISMLQPLEQKGSGKVQVALREGPDGVYRFAGIYAINGELQPGFTRKQGDILISGTFNGSHVIYGIESYFVPEKTGIELQQNARFAFVRVSQNGDALLESISTK